jgi:hypothetical protein
MPRRDCARRWQGAEAVVRLSGLTHTLPSRDPSLRLKKGSGPDDGSS